jgi:urease accessory protein
VVLGACVHAAGGDQGDAALIAATAAITGPASAAVRLLGLDPLAVQALLAQLAAQTTQAAAEAAAAAGGTGGGAAAWASLPAPAAPALDLLAELHTQEEVALFES